MRKLKQVVNIIESINSHLGVFFGYFTLLITILVIIQIVARSVFNSPTIWAEPLTLQVFGAYLLMGGAYCLLRDGHVRMDVIYNRLPSERVRAIVDVATSGLFFLFCGVLLYKAVPYSWHGTVVGARVQDMAFPIFAWPVWWCLPVATFLLAIQGLIKFGRDLSTALGRKWQL